MLKNATFRAQKSYNNSYEFPPAEYENNYKNKIFSWVLDLVRKHILRKFSYFVKSI